MKVKFFKVVFNEYDSESDKGAYYVQKLDNSTYIFDNYRFHKIDFALPLTVDDLDDVIGEDSPFIKNGDFIEFKKAVTAAESIFCYGESGGTSFCNYFIVNIAY